jgi:hypothetical protein
VAAIFWAAPLPTGQLAEDLNRFLIDGGEVVFFAPQGESTANFLGMSWSAISASEKDKFMILDSWDHGDGLLRDGLDGTPIPADRLKALKRRLPEGEATALARWDDGKTFMTRRVVDRGTAWFVGSLPDYTWSNLGDADVLLPVAQRAVAEGAKRFDAGYLASIGTRAAAPRPGEGRTRLDDYGAPVPANEPYEAGIHRFGERTMALNRPEGEDDLEILTRESLNATLHNTGYLLFEEKAVTSADSKAYSDIWRGFLVAMLFFLISEGLLCLPKRSAAAAAPLPGRPSQA